MTATVTAYTMNPAEDVILYGDQLAEGMLVLLESASTRAPSGASEERALRAQRFRRVTRLESLPADAGYDMPARIRFVGEWVDGYQEVWRGAAHETAWLVKKDSIPEATS